MIQQKKGVLDSSQVPSTNSAIYENDYIADLAQENKPLALTLEMKAIEELYALVVKKSRLDSRSSRCISKTSSVNNVSILDFPANLILPPMLARVLKEHHNIEVSTCEQNSSQFGCRFR